MPRYAYRPCFDDLTVKEYLQLKREEFLTDEEIADLYFISMATLSRWKRKNEIKAGKTPREYRELINKGYRDKDICMRWNITRSALYQWKVRKGII
jgi:hypothetical protein